MADTRAHSGARAAAAGPFWRSAAAARRDGADAGAEVLRRGRSGRPAGRDRLTTTQAAAIDRREQRHASRGAVRQRHDRRRASTSWNTRRCNICCYQNFMITNTYILVHVYCTVV